jgi:hypothetical protein
LGESITSTNGFFTLTLQQDGNVVLSDVRQGQRILWQTNTAGKGGYVLTMQTDSNLVLYSTHTHPQRGEGYIRDVLWSIDQTGLIGIPSGFARLGEDGNLVVYTPRWASKTNADYTNLPASLLFAHNLLYENQSLQINQELVSQGGKFRAVFQSDGNFVVYDDESKERALWSTKSVNKGGTRITMQNDGNLLMYRADNSAVWTSNIDGYAGSIVLMQDDGNLVIYGPIFSTNTAQPLPKKLG